MSKIKTVEKIAQRMLALKAIVIRSHCEGTVHMSKDPAEVQASIQVVNTINSWIFKEGVQEFVSPVEREALMKPAGEWDEKTFINSHWRIEALTVILWAVGMLDKIPSYDTEMDNEKMHALLRSFSSISTAKAVINIRSDNEIEKQRDVAELWHWRVRTSQMIRNEQIPPEFNEKKLLDICRTVSQKSFEAGDLPKPIEGDFPVFNKAYKNLSDEEYSLCTSIAMERHFGLNWICGYGDGWDGTPTGT